MRYFTFFFKLRLKDPLCLNCTGYISVPLVASDYLAQHSSREEIRQHIQKQNSCKMLLIQGYKIG